jgi:hypothetical protein
MPADDRDVLEFLGQQGKSLEAITERFPGFDMLRLVRAGLVEVMHIDQSETQAHGGPHSPAFQSFYVLTKRGAEAIGIDPDTVHMA